MASQSGAQKTVIASGTVMFLLTFIPIFKGHASFEHSYKRLWAVGVLTLALGVAADFAPEVIIPLSVAIVVGFAIQNPDVLGSFLGVSTKKQPKTGGTQVRHA